MGRNKLLGRTTIGICLLVPLFITACDSGSDARDLQNRVDVAANNYKSLQLSAIKTIIEVGEPLQLTLKALSDTNTQGISVADSAVWSVSNLDVATIDQFGMMTGVADGSVNVQARYGPLIQATSVQVSSAPLVSIQISAPVESVNECGSVQFVASGIYNDGLGFRDLTDNVTWLADEATTVGAFNSSDPSGFFRTNSSGQLSVTASRNNITPPSFRLDVLDNLNTVIDIPEPGGTLTTTADLQLSAVATYDGGATADITDNVSWSVSDTAKATIDNLLPSKGLLDASQTGSVTVFAACGGAPTGMRTLLFGDPEVAEIVLFSLDSPYEFPYSETTTLNLKAFVRLQTQQRVDVTEDSTWTLSQQGDSRNVLSNRDGSKGELTIRGTGTIVVQVEYTGDIYEDSTLNIGRLEIRPR